MGQSDVDRRADEDNTIVLGILQAIESGEKVTQRAVARELGIALGLVNAYVKRCMKKGLIKMRTAPARRYAYYLTPKGFSEKSRLTASYFAHSFSFFRKARTDCEDVLVQVVERRIRRVALVGAGDLAEIFVLCAVKQSVDVVAVVDRGLTGRFGGVPVVASLVDIDDVDALIVTDLADPSAAHQLAVTAVGADRVFAPALLRTRRVKMTPKLAAVSELTP